MCKILIVDDHKIAREGFKRIIGRIDACRGCEILEAGEGGGAEKIALETYPDIIITDIKMPNMTGLELISRLKPRLKNASFIIISGYDDFCFAREAIRLGVEDYLLKPFNREDVETLVVRLLAEKGKVKDERLVNANSEQRAIIRFTIDYINNNYQKDLSLTYLANLVSKSYNYFSTLFKNETGSNFSDYLRKVRIDKAKELFKNGNSIVMDVAKAVGYADYIHFSKTFTRIVGVSPAKYKSHKPL
jgi:two-component system response regulator YesN